MDAGSDRLSIGHFRLTPLLHQSQGISFSRQVWSYCIQAMDPALTARDVYITQDLKIYPPDPPAVQRAGLRRIYVKFYQAAFLR